MPINENQTLIGVPLNVEDKGETRKFLVRLLEKLDIVLGYRGDDPYVTISQLQDASSASGQSLTQLEVLILKTISENIDQVSAVLTSNAKATSESIDSLKSSSTVSDADDSTQTVSATYDQLEVQAIQDQVEDVATQLNALLAALRGTEIIAT